MIRVPGSSGGFRYAFALAQQTAGLFKAQAVQIARRGQPGATPEGAGIAFAAQTGFFRQLAHSVTLRTQAALLSGWQKPRHAGAIIVGRPEAAIGMLQPNQQIKQPLLTARLTGQHCLYDFKGARIEHAVPNQGKRRLAVFRQAQNRADALREPAAIHVRHVVASGLPVHGVATVCDARPDEHKIALLRLVHLAVDLAADMAVDMAVEPKPRASFKNGPK